MSAKPGPALTLAHVADQQRRYPGETVTFFTRVEVHRAVAGFRLQISLPPGLSPQTYRVVAGGEAAVPELVTAGEERFVIWERADGVAAGRVLEYAVEAVVAPTERALTLTSQALVTAPLATPAAERAQEFAAVLVAAQGRYLRYLPAVYSDDELMGRFLMLFESFWAPVEQQVANVWDYFDPRLAPPELLRWLATWVSLRLDERWSVAKRRRLLRSAVALYRRRGTRQGLQQYLEIYTGAEPQIAESGGNNLQLGANARLGPGLALGTANRPHTFRVTLYLPPLAGPDAERREQERRRTIEAIIAAEKPAHTDFTLRLEAAPEA